MSYLVPFLGRTGRDEEGAYIRIYPLRGLTALFPYGESGRGAAWGGVRGTRDHRSVKMAAIRCSSK